MKYKSKLRVLVLATVAVGVLSNSLAVFAAENEFSLDQVLVTALRVESKDLETPAYVNTYSEEQLKNTGAANLLEALRFTEGVVYSSMGPGGQSWGTMTSKAVIRGSERGTLVLINGAPMNMSGYYNLEDIPVESVERVEILKGAASVLYGSQAFGGVVNVITKKDILNSVSVSLGNFGQKNHSVSIQDGKFSITGIVQESGPVKPLTSAGAGYGGSDKNSVLWQYKVDNHVTLSHQHIENEYSFDKFLTSNWSTKTEQANFDDQKDYLRMQIDGTQWDSTVYASYQERSNIKYTGLNTTPTLHTKDFSKFSDQGIDTQTTWDTPFAKYLAGMTYSHATYTKTDRKPAIPVVKADASRDSYSVFLQGTRDIADDLTLIIGARQEYVEDKKGDIDTFSPQFQLLKKLDDNKSWYINAGKSFKMPTFTQLYDSGSIYGSNEDLQPEDGWSYETGWKKAGKDDSVKAAIYHMDYLGIDYQDVSGTLIPKNTPFRNTGLEVSYQKQVNDVFGYTIGASYSDPKTYNGTSWVDAFGRVQLTTGLRYHEDRWGVNLNANYLANRIDNKKPMLPVTLAASYKMDEDKMMNLNIENLLDRQDSNTHTAGATTAYYGMPFSYRLGYTQKF